MKKIKVVIVQAREGFVPGQTYELEAAEAATLLTEGVGITLAEHNAVKAQEALNQRVVKAREVAVKAAIVQAQQRGALAPQADTAVLEADAMELETAKDGMGLKYIANLPVTAKQPNTAPGTAKATDADIELGEPGVRELCHAYVKASEPFTKTNRMGGIVRAARGDIQAIKAATDASAHRAGIMEKIAKVVASGVDFKFADIFKAADFVDPAATNPLGLLNTGLTLQFNLGFLANQLAMINDITTDIANQPVLFQQMVHTRYIQVPPVQLKTTGVAWAPTTGQSVGVNVTCDQYAGVPIAFGENLLAATARQLHNELKTPQLYSLGQYVIYKLIDNIFNGNNRLANDGTTLANLKFGNTAADGYGTTNGVPSFSIGGSTLATYTADLPAAMDEAKMPGGDEPDTSEDLQRFAWVHTRAYANLAADGNYMLNQSIWGAIRGKGGNLLATGRYNRVGNIGITKSQLMVDNNTNTSDGGSPANYTVAAGPYATATKLGFAGTRSSLLFVSRVPLDYTKGLPEIPSTAAIELVTEPKTGITFVVVKFLDHAYETSNMRVALMFGTGIGDERQGMILKK